MGCKPSKYVYENLHVIVQNFIDSRYCEVNNINFCNSITFILGLCQWIKNRDFATYYEWNQVYPSYTDKLKYLQKHLNFKLLGENNEIILGIKLKGFPQFE